MPANKCNINIKDALYKVLTNSKINEVIQSVEDMLNSDIRKAEKFLEDGMKEIKKLEQEHLESKGIKTFLEKSKYKKNNEDDIFLYNLSLQKDELIEEYDSLINLARQKKGNPNLRQWADKANIAFAYHGTSANFDKFKIQPDSYSIHNVDGVYVSRDPEKASYYATVTKTTGANVLPLIIRREKIANLYNTKIKPSALDLKLNLVQDKEYPLKDIIEASKYNNSSADVTKALKKLGYTGIDDLNDTVLFNYERDIKSKFSSLFDKDNGSILALIGIYLGVKGNENRED